MSCLKLAKPFINTTRFLRLNSIPKRMYWDHCLEGSSVNPCTTEGVGKKPCKAVFPRRPPTPPKQKPQYAYKNATMWYNPTCCVAQCEPPLGPTRHDLLYLKNVHWTERNYQRTWSKCPKRCLQKVQCSELKIKVPEPERRPRGVGNPDAKWCTTLNECAKVDKFGKPCEACKPTKKCIKPVGCCRKRCTMYPSFSECYQRCIVKAKPVECYCLRPIGLCNINQYLSERGLLKKEDP